jgi:hypothetical protein
MSQSLTLVRSERCRPGNLLGPPRRSSESLRSAAGCAALSAAACRAAVPGGVRLLLKTYGCEGIGSLIEVLPANDPPRPDRKGVCISLVHLDAAADPPPNQMEHCYHPVACIHDLHNLRAVELPRGQESLGPLPQLGVTVEGAGLWDLGREDNLALGVEQGKDRVDIAAVPRFHEPIDESRVR